MDKAAAPPPYPRRRTYVVAGVAEETFWRRLLLEHNFPPWFVEKAQQTYGFNWDTILLRLRDGAFLQRYDPHSGLENDGAVPPTLEEAEVRGELLVQRLAALLTEHPYGDPVLRSLHLDGFSVHPDKLELVPLEGPIDQQQERDTLTELVRSAGLPAEAVILQHLSDAGTHYQDGKDHSAVGEARSFLQAIIDEVAVETDKHGGHSFSLPGGTKNRLQYLREVGFITADEEAAFKAAWGALCAGSHPGLTAREEARIGMVLAVEFGQILLLKFANWRANKYRGFSGP